MKKHRKKRLFGVLLIIGSSCLGIGLILYALNSNLDYFLTPSELKQSDENVVLSANTRVKLGGMVKKDCFFIDEDKTKYGIKHLSKTIKNINDKKMFNNNIFLPFPPIKLRKIFKRLSSTYKYNFFFPK